MARIDIIPVKIAPSIPDDVTTILGRIFFFIKFEAGGEKNFGGDGSCLGIFLESLDEGGEKTRSVKEDVVVDQEKIISAPF